MKSAIKLSRRDFLKLTTLTSGAAVLAACGNQATTEAPLPTEPPTATSAPQATATSEATAAPAQATDAPTATAQPTATPEPTAAPAAMPEPVEVVMWDNFVTQSPWLDGQIAAFQEATPWVTVKRITQTGLDLKTALPLSFADGTFPDFFGYVDQVQLAEQVDAGWCMPISDFADFEDFKQTYPNPDVAFLEGVNTIGGKTYQAPFTKPSGWWNQVFVNLDLLNDAGVDKIPTTVPEFVEACRAVKAAGKASAYGIAMSDWTAMLFMFMFQGGVKAWGFDHRTGKQMYRSDPNYMTIWETLITLRDEELIAPESSASTDGEMQAMFPMGNFAFFSNGQWIVGNYKENNPEFQNYTICPPFTMDGTQKYGVYMGPPTGEWKISAANNKNPEVLWAWFKWYHSKPCAELFVKDGHGMVIWPELNKEEYFSLQVQKDYARLDNEWNFVNPQPSLRNPECAYVSDGMGTPDETAITTGVFSDQITQDMLRATLDTLNDQKDQSLLDNIAAAQAEGHDVTFEDWVFPDWDPLKDYVTERKS